MRAFIIEDEIPAQINLKRALKIHCDDVDVVGQADSVSGAVEWLNDPSNNADIIFMDVELSDGMCFEIFKRVDISACVVITTAYDNYAIRAFKVNSIDYLLKPIDPKELVEAVNRCRETVRDKYDGEAIEKALRPLSERVYKKRFAVRFGDKIVIVNSEDVAYIYAGDKSVCLATKDNKRYVLDQSLDSVASMMDPSQFFRLSRSYLASISAIKTVSKHLSSRLKITLEPASADEVFVSRSRLQDFVRWLDGE